VRKAPIIYLIFCIRRKWIIYGNPWGANHSNISHKYLLIFHHFHYDHISLIECCVLNCEPLFTLINFLVRMTLFLRNIDNIGTMVICIIDLNKSFIQQIQKLKFNYIMPAYHWNICCKKWPCQYYQNFNCSNFIS